MTPKKPGVKSPNEFRERFRHTGSAGGTIAAAKMSKTAHREPALKAIKTRFVTRLWTL